MRSRRYIFHRRRWRTAASGPQAQGGTWACWKQSGNLGSDARNINNDARLASGEVNAHWYWQSIGSSRLQRPTTARDIARHTAITCIGLAANSV